MSGGLLGERSSPRKAKGRSARWYIAKLERENARLRVANATLSAAVAPAVVAAARGG